MTHQNSLLTAAIAGLCVLFSGSLALAEVVIDYDFTAAEGWSSTFDNGSGSIGVAAGQVIEGDNIVGHASYKQENPNGQPADNPWAVWKVNAEEAGAGSDTGTITISNNWIGMASDAPVSNVEIGQTVKTTIVYKRALGISENTNPSFNFGFRIDTPTRRPFGPLIGTPPVPGLSSSDDARPFLDPGEADAFGGAVEMYWAERYNIGDPLANDGFFKYYVDNDNGASDENPIFMTPTNVAIDSATLGATPNGIGSDGTPDFETDWLEVVHEVTKLDPPTIDDPQWEATISVRNVETDDPGTMFTTQIYGDTAFNSTTWYPSLRSGDLKNNFDVDADPTKFVKLDSWKVEVLRNDGFAADVDEDGDVDGQDYLQIQRTDPALIPTWVSEYGSTTPLAASSAIPEPTTLAMGLISCGLTCLCRRHRA